MTPARLTEYERCLLAKLQREGRMDAKALGIGQQGALHRLARKGCCIEHGSQRYNAYRYWTYSKDNAEVSHER